MYFKTKYSTLQRFFFSVFFQFALTPTHIHHHFELMMLRFFLSFSKCGCIHRSISCGNSLNICDNFFSRLVGSSLIKLEVWSLATQQSSHPTTAAAAPAIRWFLITFCNSFLFFNFVRAETYKSVAEKSKDKICNYGERKSIAFSFTCIWQRWKIWIGN